MTWRLTKDRSKWKVYGTKSELLISEFSSEIELKRFIALDIIYRGKLEAIKELMTFPNSWAISDKTVPPNANKEVLSLYYQWVKDIYLISRTKSDLYSNIDRKLNELMELDK